MENEKEYQKNVGAIWNKISNNEKKTPYKTLSIDMVELKNQGVDLTQDKINLVIFRNYNKQKETQPDYKVLVPTKHEVYSPRENKYIAPKSIVNKEEGVSEEDEELFNESSEIPF